MKTEKKSRDYTFGTFEDRLDHVCLVFNAEPPKLDYGESSEYPFLDDELMAWLIEHDICMDWLFAGSPDGLLRHWSERNNDLGWLLQQIPNMSQAELRILCDKLKELR